MRIMKHNGRTRGLRVGALIGLAVLVSSSVAAARSDRSVPLGHGAGEGAAWSVSVQRTVKGNTSSSACLNLYAQLNGTGSESRECGSVRSDLPLFGRLALGKGKQQITVFAAVLPPNVFSVGLGLGSRGFQKARVSHIGRRRAEAAGLNQYAYLSRSFRGPVCIKRLRAYDSAGIQVTNLPFIRCHES